MEYGFQRVIAWQKAHEFVLLVYKISKHFPEDERFGLTSQLRRVAVSIEANIAEGYRKLSKPDKLRFLNIAQITPPSLRSHSTKKKKKWISTYQRTPGA